MEINTFGVKGHVSDVAVSSVIFFRSLKKWRKNDLAVVVAQLVEGLRRKTESSGFESCWGP